MKTEPNSYSVHDLAAEPKKTTFWDGVRNYQARNLLRDDIKKGDFVLIYHSNANPPAVAGVATVVKEGYPDHTAWDVNGAHYDPKSTPENPRWYMVDIKLKQIFKREVSLPELREIAALRDMVLLQKGSRLSVQPVSKSAFERIVKLGAK
jgi:predicted RNA-binding protein with PUA-like domain